MKMSILTAASVAVACLFIRVSSATAVPNSLLAPFPRPDADQTRHVIHVPPRSDEPLYQVEIQVGKTLTVDCNHYAFGGELTEHHVPNWGYDYFVYSREHPLVSTEMACPPDSERTLFIQAVDANRMLRYNSRMPIVLYTPRDMEVKYQLWHVETTPTAAVQQ